jgi:hypothetical protein
LTASPRPPVAGTRPESALARHVVASLLIGWLLASSYLSLGDAARWLLSGTRATLSDGESWRISFGAFVLAIAISLAAGLARPARWRWLALTAALPVPVLLLTSRHLLAGLALVGLLIPTAWLGRELAAALLDRAERLEAWAVGGAFGIGIVAALGLALGVCGLLRPVVLWPLLVAMTVALATTRRQRMLDDLAALVTWAGAPRPRRPIHALLCGAAVGCFWLNLVGALAPETGWDAVVHHLASAASFARTGNLSVDDPDLWVGALPAAGEIVYAAALTVGPLQTAKLLNFVVGLWCAVAIFATGRHLGRAVAGAVAALAFYTMPVVSWLSTTAYLDLLVTLFGVAAALGILLVRKPTWRSTLAPAVCIGLGVATKVQFAYVAVSLALTLGVLGWYRHGLLPALRLVATLAAMSLLAALPWLARSYLLTGAVPGLDVALAALTGSSGKLPSRYQDLAQFAEVRSLDNLLRAPFDVTLQSRRFGGWVPGFIGYLLFALLPLLVLVRPRPTEVAIVVGAATGFVLWFYTVQMLRYGLPIFGMLCPVAGVAYIRARANLVGARLQAVAAALLVLPVVAGVSLQLDRMKESNGPEHAVVLGLMDESSFLTRYGLGYAALQLLDAEPTATRAWGPYHYARLYTRVPLSSPFPQSSGAPVAIEAEDDVVLQRLDEGGYSHIIVDRGRLPADWDRISAIDEGFLRRNTAVVGGGANSYLYRLLSPDQRGVPIPWARGQELLPNGGFEEARDGAPAGWTAQGHPRYSTSGEVSCSGRAAVLSSQKDYFMSRVKAVPGQQYLLSHATRSAQGYGQARLQLNWLDGAGRLVHVDIEVVPTGSDRCYLYSLLATAPPNAVAADVYAQAQDSDVWFDDFSLRSVEPDTGRSKRAG